MLEHWGKMVNPESLWIAYGGTKDNFSKILHGQKYFLHSNRIRVRDLQRERQSYCEIFASALQLGISESVDYVHVAEFDQIPLQANVNELQRLHLSNEHADAHFYQLRQIDGTNHAHYIDHAMDARWSPFLESISRRPDKTTTLSALGFGSFWSKDAFELLAAVDEPMPVYLELFLPTVAHHLGCRVRDNGQNARFALTSGDATHLQPTAAAQGAWFLHPCKSAWNK